MKPELQMDDKDVEGNPSSRKISQANFYEGRR